jgi:dTDP-4-dehydrorhamnose 3,5-epimerase
MKATPLAIVDVLAMQPRVFEDGRGLFFESYNASDFEAATGHAVIFVQDNHSRSKRNVLRGLHYQIGKPQGKLIRVVSGEIFDVAVDLRCSSPSFGCWVGEYLSADNNRQIWIPPGFAHGFLAVSDAVCLYKTTDYYSAEHERCISWDDPTLKIEWPLVGAPILSERDSQRRPFAGAEVFP